MGWTKSSEENHGYNCIAWALRLNNIWLWPAGDWAWPRPHPAEVTVQEFIDVFALFGFELCTSWIFEAGQEKIALYTLDGKPTHAARQLQNGKWTSKLGAAIDITHDRVADFPNDGQYACRYGGAHYFFRRERCKAHPTYDDVASVFGGQPEKIPLLYS